MVNRGTPSRGCNECKRRRIKCDETKPHCVKCTRTNRICPGVPDEFELILRNQTRKVARKVQRDAQKHSSSGDDRLEVKQDKQLVKKGAGYGAPDVNFLSLHDRELERISWRRYENTIFPELCTPADTQAVMYFFQTWSRPPVPGKSQEMLYLDVLPGIFAEAPASSAIHEAIVALAFRIFANAHRSDDLSDHATMRYGSTLRQLGKELVRSNQIKDDTLATVLLLMLYECFQNDNSGNYIRHMKGAVTLLRQRGLDNFNSVKATKILVAIRAQIAARYTFRSKSIMPLAAGGNWMEFVGSPWLKQYASLSVRTNAIRARCDEILTSSHPDLGQIRDLVKQAGQLDLDVARMHELAPAEWRHSTISCLSSRPNSSSSSSSQRADKVNVQDSPIWPGTKMLLVYRKPLIAAHQNALRMLRVYAQAAIVRCLWFFNTQDTDDFDAEQHESSVRIIQQMANDVCATIPSMLTPDIEHYLRSKTGSLAGAEALHEKTFLANAQTALLTLQPAYAMSTIECLSASQRLWLKGRLQSLAQDWGLMHGMKLATARPCLISSNKPFETPICQEHSVLMDMI